MANSNRHINYLQERGVVSAAGQMHWTKHEWHGIPGFAIPVHDHIGRRYRFRAITPLQDGSKTRWLGQSGSYTPKFYAPDDVAEAVAANAGRLIVAAGEFDLLTFVENGQRNVIAFSSENSIPRDLGRIVAGWGVRHVDYWPDNDDAGRASARKLADRLDEAGITYTIYDLSGQVEAKGDTNDLWQAVGFDRGAFRAALDACPLLNLPPSEKATQRPDTPVKGNHGDFPADYVQAIIQAVYALPKARKSGENVIACSPFREDNNPSFSFSPEKLTWYDFGTGEGGGIVELGHALGIDIRDYTPRTFKGTYRPSNTGTQDGKPSYSPQPLEPFTPDSTYNVRYVDHIPLSARTIALRSGIGTGKTEAIIQRILKDSEKYSRVLFLAHRQSLTVNQVERLNQAGITVHLYNEIDDTITELGNIDKLVCTLDSAYRLADAEPFDLVVMDEIEQSLRHLVNGGTMDGAGQEASYATLEKLLREAGQVVALDAHLTDITADWLGRLRGDVLKVKNTHHHRWGQMTVYNTLAALVQAAHEAILQDSGPVVIPTGSRESARLLRQVFGGLLGEAAIQTIHGHNSMEAKNKDFIRHINDRLPQVKLFITTPSVGTGVDVQAHVAGVFGYFPGAHLAPNEIMQQMTRYRNADTYAIHVPHGERLNLVTDADTLLANERYKTMRTSDLARFAQHNLRPASPAQGTITRLWADLKAADNRAKRHLRDSVFTLAIAEGFTLAAVDRDAPAMQERLREGREALAQSDKAHTLAAAPISKEELDRQRQAGMLTEDAFFGYTRHLIEQTTGQTITGDLYDDYKSPKGRAALRRFTTFHMGGLDDARQMDRAEVSEMPYHRGHHTVDQVLFRRMLHAVFGPRGLDNAEVIPAGEVEQRMEGFLAENLPDVQRYLDNGRTDLSTDPMRVLHRIFKRFGLKLASRVGPRDEDGHRRREYWIDQGRLALMRVRAEFRWAWLEQNAREQESESRVLCHDGPLSTSDSPNRQRERGPTRRKRPVNPFARATT